MKYTKYMFVTFSNFLFLAMVIICFSIVIYLNRKISIIFWWLKKENILKQYPLLNDKMYICWDGKPAKIVKALLGRLLKEHASTSTNLLNLEDDKAEIYVPLLSIKKNFTQREKDTFLKESFKFIKSYFQKALLQLKSKYPEVETDFTDINQLSFMCTIYLNGDISNKCKIWVGGIFNSNSISYQEGYHIDIHNNSTVNDYLVIKDHGNKLGFENSNMWLGYQPQSKLA